MAEQTQQPTNNSISYRIDDLEAQDAHEFFDSSDWHLDNKLSFTNKFKTSTGSAKFVLKGKASNKDDGITYKTNFEAQLNTKLDSKDAQFKFKPGKITSHFDLGFKQVGKNWLNPYVVVNTPTTFKNINADSKTTLGAVFHMNHFDKIPATVNLNLNIGQKEGRYTFDFIKNSLLNWKNFTFSSIAKIGLSGPVIKKTHETSLQYAHGSMSAYFAMNNGSDLVCPKGINEISAGLTHSVCDKLTVAAEGIRTLGDDASDEYNLGLTFNHCPGFNWTFVTKNFESIGMLIKMKSKKKNLDVSACYEKSLKDADDFNWGLKFAYKQ